MYLVALSKVWDIRASRRRKTRLTRHYVGGIFNNGDATESTLNFNGIKWLTEIEYLNIAGLEFRFKL